MKIKSKKIDYGCLSEKRKDGHKMPVKQSVLLRKVLDLVSGPELKAVNFTYTVSGMERLGSSEPCLILMNHSSFTDLQITSRLLKDRDYHIVCTRDGFVGKDFLMRHLGGIPTDKFVSDVRLVKDMKYCLERLHSSVLMFPEASYSFDGTATPLPESLGKCIKLFKVPVVIIRSRGAFLRDPLYNGLQKRKVDVSAHMKYLLSPDDVKTLTPEAINRILKDEFAYDHFREQYDSKIVIDEQFRADGLNRVLYKCPHCFSEGKMRARGTMIRCEKCNAGYSLETDGRLKNTEPGKKTSFQYVSDWYAWERYEVRKEIEEGTYCMDEDVCIKVLYDTKALYDIGEGHLRHDNSGFLLTGAEGRLRYTRNVSASYSLYADYYWYEIGDMICIGDNNMQYYCFPKDQENAIVAKARLAAEEMYRLHRINLQTFENKGKNSCKTESDRL